MSETFLVRIEGEDFVVGAVIEDDRIVRMAPLLAGMMRWRGLHHRDGLRELVRSHRSQWKVERLP